MPKRVLAIGVGGSGKAALTILKERLEEAYGNVPDNVVLLSIDTDDLRDIDVFAGTQLNPQFDQRGREPEFAHVVSPPGITMDTIFADMARGRTSAYMSWLEDDKLQRRLAPTERDIRGGAQQRRPIGRTALFLRWNQPVYSAILNAIQRMYGEPEEERPVDDVKLEQSKRLVFVLGSVAGGTGSGFLIDIANLVSHAIRSNTAWQSIDVSAVIVLPDAFSAYTTVMEDPTNLRPNSYAALRELDRFTRVHDANLPYMVRYGADIRSITWSTNQPLDHVYLVDTTSRSATSDLDLSGNPLTGVFPLMADFVMCHIDQSLSDALATLRSNAGQHYDKEEGWQYSGFNIMTYIFPVDDVIESFSYRFLREMLARQFLPIGDVKLNAQVEQGTIKETEHIFSQTHVLGKVNPGIMQKAIVATRRMDPEQPDLSWQGLFNLIALSDTAFAEDFQDLDQSLAYLSSYLMTSRSADYKRESFDEGYSRLLNFGDQFMDDFLGPQIDRDDEESRFGGDWDKILGRYREALRLRLAEALDAALLDILNKRNPQTKVLEPARLSVARMTVATLKDRLIRFRKLLEKEYTGLQIESRVRLMSEQVRSDITWMQTSKDRRPPLFGKPEAQKAQEAYISSFAERMELLLHQRVYRVVIDVLDSLGAAEQDSTDQKSVIDLVGEELENWDITYKEVDRIVVRRLRAHDANRQTKKSVKVRRYLTNPEFETQLYQQPEHVGAVSMRVLGQLQGERGMTWERRLDDEPLHYRLITTWGEEARGAEEIANKFFDGAKDLFQVVRDNVCVADRIASEFSSAAAFVNTANTVSEPFLRYSPSLNKKSMFPERYVSVSVENATDEAISKVSTAQRALGEQGVNVASAESRVACTVVYIARGAHLNAVDQFVNCQTDYRTKLYRGQESIHLFPEEQVATVFEGRIEVLGEADNKERPLTPQLVVAMGDRDALVTFIRACAFRLIEDGIYIDPATEVRSVEIFLDLSANDSPRRLALSERDVVRNLDPAFANVTGQEQLARLYLNALQNFTLKVLQKPGVGIQEVPVLTEALLRRGVALARIANPYTLPIREVNAAINRQIEALGPTKEEMSEATDKQREAHSARRQLEQYLEPFLNGEVRQFKSSPVQRIRDLGTVMDLVLREEINQLREVARGG